jgi:hypothetical protein
MSAALVPFPSPALATAAPAKSAPPSSRAKLLGGTYDPITAINLMNPWFFVSERDGEVGIYRIEDDGRITHLQIPDFMLLLSNVYVKDPQKPNARAILIAKFWLSHPNRRTCERIVFEPSLQVPPGVYNLYRGLSIAPKRGFQRTRRLLQHIFRIVCRRDKEKFKYLMMWLAWAVQNPHLPAETIVILKSEVEGTGKTTLGKVMLTIFGVHGLLVDNKDQLLGNFNSHLETTCFVLAEEIYWAGDYSVTDALKSVATSHLLSIDEKYRRRRQVPSHLKMMFTTNHAWAISAGKDARRWFVLDVSDEKAGDDAWFKPMYHDIENGGVAEFLHLLLNLKLGEWHPRHVPKTEELVEQQILSAGSVEEWLLACADLDAIVGGPDGSTGRQLDTDVPTEALYNAYCDYIRRRTGIRAQPLVVFGKTLTKLFGAPRKLPANGNGPRKNGYPMPDASRVRTLVEKYIRTGKVS